MKEAELVARLRASKVRVATAESCTGGQIASRLTQVAGASDVFWGGWVVYDNSAKISQLGVPAELIAAKGAVSPEVAKALAASGLRAMSAASAHAGHALCVATTGIAGPGGATSEKPVGLCYVGIAASGGRSSVREVRTPPGQDRQANQLSFSNAAFEEIEKLLTDWAADTGA